MKRALQMAGLVKKSRKRGGRRRERRPLPGMLLHLEGSSHAWFQDDRRYDLLVILGCYERDLLRAAGGTDRKSVV